MRAEHLDEVYLDPARSVAPPAAGRPAITKYTPDCLDCWRLAYRITNNDDLAWVNPNRVDDVVTWLHSQGCRRGPLNPAFHAELNDGLALPAPASSESPDIRVYVPRIIQMIEKTTLLHLDQRLRDLIRWGVVDADILLFKDFGRGPIVQLLHRLARVRDTQGNLGGGLRRFMATTDDIGITPHEAHTVALLLLGTARRDQDAKPIRYGGFSTQLGASSALVCTVLGVRDVSLDTALDWAHTAKRAMDPRISRGDMRHHVTNPIKRMAAGRSNESMNVNDRAIEAGFDGLDWLSRILTPQSRD